MRIVPGSGAVVQVIFNQSYGVQSFNVLNGGIGYASTNPPDILIQNTTTPTVNGSFYPVISNGQIVSIKVLSSGQGYLPLGTPVVASGIASVGTNQNIASIYVSNPGYGYTSIPTVTIAPPSLITGIGTYQFNEVVVGSRSGTTARVKNWDKDTKVLKVSIVDGDFFPGEVITGTISSAIYSVKNFDRRDLYDKYSQNVEIEIEADSILDFSESNPFGNY
jgi:hypothetical protein